MVALVIGMLYEFDSGANAGRIRREHSRNEFRALNSFTVATDKARSLPYFQILAKSKSMSSLTKFTTVTYDNDRRKLSHYLSQLRSVLRQKHVYEVKGADEEDEKHRLSEIFEEDHRALYTGIQ